MFRLAAILALSATSATALSCLPPDIARSYTFAAEAEETYMILLGTFSFDQAQLPQRTADNDNPENTFVQAEFTGGAFNGRNFGNERNGPVTINAQCFGPWCSWIQDGSFGLAFVEVTDGTTTLSLSPCGGFFFPDPTLGQIAKIRSCHKGADCLPDDG